MAGHPPAKKGRKSADMQEYHLLIDSLEYSRELERAIGAATQSIYMQFLTFEADVVGERYARLLMEKAGDGLDVRLILDGYYQLIVSDRSVRFPTCRPAEFRAVRREFARTKKMIAEMRAGGVQILEINNRFHGLALLRRNHKKIVVVDCEKAYLGGFNLSEHNFAWHDFAVGVSGSVVKGIAEDFDSTWHGRPASYPMSSNGDFLLGNVGDNKVLRDYIFQAIDNARSDVFIECPYIGGAVFEKLLAAAGRGVSVSVIYPKRNNIHRHSLWMTKHLEQYMVNLAAKSNIRVSLYNKNGGMTHAKVMLVDGEIACFGSCNFDAFGFRFYDDLNLVSRNESLIQELGTRVVEEDLKYCEPFLAGKVASPRQVLGRIVNSAYRRLLE